MKFVEFALGLSLWLLLWTEQGVLAATTPASATTPTTNEDANEVVYSSPTSSSASSRPSHPLGGQSIVMNMAVTPSNLDITYVPELAWITHSSQQDSASCLAGTKSSSTPGSYLEYKFTGSGIQLYTAASATAGSFVVTLDGTPYGSFSVEANETGSDACAPKLLVDINSLPAVAHTLKVTVVEGPTGPDGINFIFAGFGLSSTSSNSSLLRNNNAAADPPVSHKNNVGAIVGSVFGAIGGVLLLALGIFFFLRRRRIAATTTQTPVKEMANPALTYGRSKEDDERTICSDDHVVASKV